jgi:hypothetical protein
MPDVSGRRRSGLRIALAAGFCLLFQQLALAAYECPGSRGLQGDAGEAALCASHCSPDSPAQADIAKSAAAMAVPVLLLGLRVAASSSGQPAARPEPPQAAADPPPRLRYCTLLI